MDTSVFSIVGNPDDDVQVMKANSSGQFVKATSDKKDRPKK